MTPADVRIFERSSDGDTAVLKVEGRMQGEAVKGEVILKREGRLWLPTSISME